MKSLEYLAKEDPLNYFAEPVDVSMVPGYRDVVRYDMDENDRKRAVWPLGARFEFVRFDKRDERTYLFSRELCMCVTYYKQWEIIQDFQISDGLFCFLR